MEKLRIQALNNIIIRTTLNGALQRGKVYKKGLPDNKKAVFRKSLAKELGIVMQKVQQKQTYNDAAHFKTIERFATHISKNYGDVLHQRKLRIGTAQKMINLYWKMSWLLHQQHMPPIHCPFDSVVIKQLDTSVQHIRWTTSNSMEDYKLLVKAAKKVAGNNVSIAEWELENYGLKVNYK